MTRIHQLIRLNLGIHEVNIQTEIAMVALAYMLKVTKAKDLNATIAEHTDINPLNFRNSLRQAYIIKNLKFWLWYCAYNNLSRSEADDASDDFEIRPKDFELLPMLRRSKYWRPLQALAQTKITRHKDPKRIGKLRYRAMSLQTVNREIERILLSLDTYLKKYVFKKLKFITHNGYTDAMDIFNELQFAGVSGVYAQYPLIDSRLHLTNIFKCTIQNYGCNLIKFYTTQSRNVLVKEADGTFTSKKQSIDSMPPGWLDTLGSSYDDIEIKYDIENLYLQSNPLEKNFLRLISGEYDKDFSSYLLSQGYADSDETFDKMLYTRISKFISLAANYLGIDRNTKDTYIDKLKTHFA